MNGVTLDAGALIAMERRDMRIRALLRRVVADGLPIHIPTGALAQAWRDHPRQHALRVLSNHDNVDVVPLDLRTALATGTLCAATSTRDIVDASVAICAEERGSIVVTSDPDDIAALDPRLKLVTI